MSNLEISVEVFWQLLQGLEISNALVTWPSCNNTVHTVPGPSLNAATAANDKPHKATLTNKWDM